MHPGDRASACSLKQDDERQPRVCKVYDRAVYDGAGKRRPCMPRVWPPKREKGSTKDVYAKIYVKYMMEVLTTSMQDSGHDGMAIKCGR